MKENFDYVVAGRWPCGTLKIYAYRHEIQHGSLEDAHNFLAYVKSRSPADDWKIYKINYEEVV